MENSLFSLSLPNGEKATYFVIIGKDDVDPISKVELNGKVYEGSIKMLGLVDYKPGQEEMIIETLHKKLKLEKRRPVCFNEQKA